MAGRRPLPNRRPSVNWKVRRPVSFADPSAGETTFFVTVGFDPETLRPMDVFYAEGFRSGSDLEFTTVDACIVISIAMQHGVRAEEMARSLSRRERADGSHGDASVLPLILRAVAEARDELMGEGPKGEGPSPAGGCPGAEREADTPAETAAERLGAWG